MTGTQPREPRGPASRPVVALLVAGESGPGRSLKNEAGSGT